MAENQIVKEIGLDLIDDPRHAMRTDIDDDGIEELMASIKAHGLIQPITVRPFNNRFEVIAGHRRFRAHQRLGLATIKCLIREANEDETLVLKAHENLLRRDVNVVDEACFIGEFLERTKKEPAEFATMINRSENYVRERLEVFSMPQLLKEYLLQDRVSIGAALWLNRIEDENTRTMYTNWAATNGVSVAGAKMWFLRWKAGQAAINVSEIRVETPAGEVQRVRKATTCHNCKNQVFLDEANTVWIHPAC